MERSGNLLEGVRVLDLTRVMSGPFCTAMLADLGAEVIKVEMPGFGEEGRHFAPYKDGESAYFLLLNRGKKSVTVNLKSEEGIALIRSLAARSDVLVENFRPGVMARLGLDEATLRAANPRLIYASISGFGQSGPFADLPAFDLVIQAMSGLMSLTGPRDGVPTAVGESMADICTGMFASWGVLAALFDRERTGKGRRLEVAMLDSVFSMLLTSLSRRLYVGETPTRVGNRHPETYPVDSFPTRDGGIVIVGFSDAVFAAAARAIERPELAQDERFLDNAARNRNEGALRAIFAAWTGGRSTEDAIERFRAAGVPCAPIWSLDELLRSGHIDARGMIASGRHSKLGEIPLVPQPVMFAGAPRPEGQIAPCLGEHTASVLGEVLGLTPEEIEGLRERKAV